MLNSPRRSSPGASGDASRKDSSRDSTCLTELHGRELDDLHESASRLLRHERRSHTLTPTALVNEAFIRLARQRKRVWESPERFLAAATGMMKRVLSNHARDRQALKRGGTNCPAHLDEAAIPEIRGGSSITTVRNTLERLRARDPRAADIVELRLYRGLGNDVIADMLGLSLRTTEREWAAARAWLQAELSKEQDP